MMRRALSLATTLGLGVGLGIGLGGCSGLGKFLGDTETLPGANPNATTGISENLLRARGQKPDEAAIVPQNGDVWPGPPQPLPTLGDVAKNGGLGESSAVLGGSMPNGGSISMGEKQSIRNGAPTGNPTGDAATSFSGGAGALPSGIADPATGFRRAHPLGVGPAPSEKGEDVKGADGPVGGNIVIPNGDGTSTVISPDGTVKTVKGTPR